MLFFLKSKYVRIASIKKTEANFSVITAAEFHTRHLILARKLGDRCGEARACTALAEDCAALGEARKALYFYVLHAQIAAEVYLFIYFWSSFAYVISFAYKRLI